VLAFLERYCENDCTPEERAYVEGNDALVARAAALRRQDAQLRRLFVQAMCADESPSPQELIDYVDGRLAESGRRFVERWAQHDPEIQAEICLLRRLGRNPLIHANPP
jgi:anti-sigma factor RsiW